MLTATQRMEKSNDMLKYGQDTLAQTEVRPGAEHVGALCAGQFMFQYLSWLAYACHAKGGMWVSGTAPPACARPGTGPRGVCADRAQAAARHIAAC